MGIPCFVDEVHVFSEILGCHQCPCRLHCVLQALAETLKDVTDINVVGKEIGNEEAKAWC